MNVTMGPGQTVTHVIVCPGPIVTRDYYPLDRAGITKVETHFILN